MAHTHDHGHGHHHHHGDEDPYYLDQVCQLAVTSTFAGICLILYFFRSENGDILDTMLSRRFHMYVLWGGIALMVIAVIRAVCLWQQAREDAALAHHHHGHDHHHHHGHDHHGHSHAHGHSHDHDHSHCHEHSHEHAHGHDHAHEHSHEHAHSHAQEVNDPGPHLHAGPGHHGQDPDHEHGWAPWRYVVLMVPIVLFLLGLPNKPPEAQAADSSAFVEPLLEARWIYEDKKYEDVEEPNFPAMVAAALVPPVGMDPPSSLALAGSFAYEKKEKAEPPLFVEYRQLFDSQNNAKAREYYKRKTVLLKGQFKHSDNPRVVSVARFLRQCCSADAVPIYIPVVGKRPLNSVKDASWVHVTGKVDYYKRGDRHLLRIMVSDARSIVETRLDESPFIDN